MIPTRATPRRAALLLIALLAIAAILLVQRGAYLNHDVGWFSWGARALLTDAVPGGLLVEPNFPLAFLVYAPAALIAPLIGLSAAVKLWLVVLTALSMVLGVGRLPEERRLAFVAALGLFVAFAFPREFAQREQIAFLFVLPYCLPASGRRRRDVLIGVLAGIGFAIKPHFLLAWLFCEIGKRPFRVEQRALVLIGIAYFAVILIFFPRFLSEMLPITRALYWTFDRPSAAGILILPSAIAFALLAVSRLLRDVPGTALAWAAIGFLAAALAQQRFYIYQVLPAWGMIVVASAVLAAGPKRRWIGILGLAVSAPFLLVRALPWWYDVEGRRPVIAALTAELDRYPSFAVISVHPFPAFSTALYTRAHYIGNANSHWYLPTAAQTVDPRIARLGEGLARRHALAELARRPAVVIVDRNWSRHTESIPDEWDGLGFLTRDPRYSALWHHYKREKTVADYDIYIRADMLLRPHP